MEDLLERIRKLVIQACNEPEKPEAYRILHEFVDTAEGSMIFTKEEVDELKRRYRDGLYETRVTKDGRTLFEFLDLVTFKF